MFYHILIFWFMYSILLMGCIHRMDRLDKMAGKKTFRIRLFFWPLVTRAMRPILSIDEDADLGADNDKIRFGKCKIFRNTVTKSALFWQLISHFGFFGIVTLGSLRIDGIGILIIPELILFGLYLIAFIIYWRTLNKKEKAFKKNYFQNSPK